MRTREEVEHALRLDALGLNRCEIARRLDIPRSTIKHWLTGHLPDFDAPPWPRRPGRRGRRPLPPRDPAEAPPDAYSYLLGVYLGDGYLARLKNTFAFRVSCDARYPGIIDQIACAIGAVMPGRNVGRLRHSRGDCIVVFCTCPDWPAFFPQHGPGRKHTRRIELADWQREITTGYPREFIRGLIQTDGCRFIACQPGRNGKPYRYARYSFSNRSDDIRRLFVEHMDLLGIPCRQANRFNIEISRKEAVAALDEFVGKKR